MGLLVWQDFMFACNLYPSTPDFLAEVSAEVDHQVRRLGSHPAIAIWCGDNELIGALTWFEEPRKNRDRYLVNYDRLNRTIEEAMRTADANAIWWPSSPSPGTLSFGDAWHDDFSGDMHFWSVWHEGRDFEHYRDVRPRFCSEFGFQSFPSQRSGAPLPWPTSQLDEIGADSFLFLDWQGVRRISRTQPFLAIALQGAPARRPLTSS